MANIPSTPGNDLLRGGAGADTFQFLDRGWGQDTITDFELGTDKLDLRVLNVADFATLAPYVQQVGDDTVIATAFGGRFDNSNEAITLQGISLAALAANPSNILFNTNTTNTNLR